MDNDVREEEIDLREIFFLIRSNLLIIFLSIIIGGMFMYFVSACFMNKKFVSSTKFYVLNKQEEQTLTYTDLQTGSQLTKDYAELVTSRTVMMQVMAELKLQDTYSDMADMTADELAEMITVTTKDDTRIVEIQVEDTNPTRAQDIANAVRKSASEHIADVMNIEAVNVVDYANLPESPSSPDKLKLAIIGACIGMVISVAVIVIRFIIDDTIRTPDDIEKYLGLSVLASIPYDEDTDGTDKRDRRRKKTQTGGKKSRKSGSRVPTIK